MSTTRADGRDVDEIRPVEISFDELDRADGSARFAFGMSPPPLFRFNHCKADAMRVL